MNDQEEIIDDRKYYTPYGMDLFNLTGGQIEEYMLAVKNLNENSRNILTNFSTAEFIEDILGANFNLSDSQKQEIARIIREIIMAIIFIGDLVPTISSRLQLDLSTAQKIADQLISQLFAPALEDIKKVQREKFGDRINNSPVPTPIAPLQSIPVLTPRPSLHEQNMSQLIPQPPLPPLAQPSRIQGQDLPESGGNILDLRGQKPQG